MKLLSFLIFGIIFGLGLGISGMTDPHKVMSFLDVTGSWDPSLLLVMGAAVGINFFAFRWILNRRKPAIDSSFHLPKQKKITASLVGGSILFGIGWGLSGFCPGAAIAAVPSGEYGVFLFIGSMIVGIALHDRVLTPPSR